MVSCVNASGGSATLTVVLVLSALAASGCASYSTYGTQSEPAQAMASAHRHSRTRSDRQDRALLVPQPAPNCDYDRAQDDTVDADLWARLKVEYERHCYQQAEVLVRNRLRLLQASGKCATVPTRSRRHSFSRS
jgi:hypothetical protein